MNSLRNNLRSVLFALTAVLALASCSKKSEDVINPDAGAELEGIYTVSQIRLTSTGQVGSVPAGNQISIGIERVSETEVNLGVEQVKTGQNPETSVVEGIELRRSGRAVGLYDAAGNQQGTYENGTLELTITEASGRALTFIARKQ